MLPSARSGTLPRPASEADLEAVIAAFGEAAAQAQGLGFDGVAVHGAHGYLIYQFLWERSNRREDRWGGTRDNRSRLAIEVVREIRRRVGPDFPIMFRFSQWSGWDYNARLAESPQELEAFLCPLADAGVDIFDASTRRFWEPAFAESDMNLAGWAKRVTGKAAMTVGSIGLDVPLGDEGQAAVGASAAQLARLGEMLDRGDFDLVAVGRALLGDPDWPTKVRDGRWDQLLPYDKDATARELR